MPTVILTIDQLDARISNLVRGIGVRDFAPVWPGVAQLMVSDVRQNFAGQHAPDGTPWVPLAHGRPGQPEGALPLRDRGLLLASINGQAYADGAAVGTNLIYGPVHQYGAHIVPVRAKFLSIPLTKEAKRAGSPRNFPGNPHWRFVPTHSGGWLMLAGSPLTAAQRINRDLRTLEGKRATAAQQRREAAVPQYLLVKSVDIPARPFLGFSAKLLTKVEQLIVERGIDLIRDRLMGRHN